MPDIGHTDQYEALSYCWGSPDDVERVHFNGQSEPFIITQNLYAALRRLRWEKRPRLLWVDALCINQYDLTERAQQVSMMRIIYTQASRVIVWLGVFDDRFDSTSALIRAIAKEHCSDPASWKQQDKNVISQSEVKDASGLPPSNDTSWPTLADFLELPWFFRVWVVQEVQSGKEVEVLCNYESLPWKTVTAAAAWFRASPQGQWVLSRLRGSVGDRGAFMGTSQIHFMGIRRLVTHQEAPFLRVLDRAMSFHASDPRDKIFALLAHPTQRCSCKTKHSDCREVVGSFASDGREDATPNLGMQIDYSLSVVDVLQRLTLLSIQQGDTLESLNYAWKQRREHFDLGDHLGPDQSALDVSAYPTWVPQWDAVINNRRAHFRAYLYNAALDTKSTVQKCRDPKAIIVRGIQLDVVRETNVMLSIGPCDQRGQLEDLSRILIQDHRHTVDGVAQDVDQLHARVGDSISSHLANFAAYVIKVLGQKRHDVFMPLNNISCHVCNTQIATMTHAYDSKVTSHNCHSCHMGAFDICDACWKAGNRCPVATHKIAQRTVQGIHCQYDQAWLTHIADLASKGSAREFALDVGSAFDRRAVFITKGGLIGVCPLLVTPGDTVVVLFGGRSPFILGRHGDHYRLVSDCYVHNVMDGEAVDLCRAGRLKAEDFELH